MSWICFRFGRCVSDSSFRACFSFGLCTIDLAQDFWALRDSPKKNTYVYVYIYIIPKVTPNLTPPKTRSVPFLVFLPLSICKRRCFSVRWAGVQPWWTNVTFAQPAQCMELSCCRRCVAFNGALGASRQYQQHKCDTSWPFTLQVMFFPVLRRTTDDDPLGRPFAAVGVKSRGWGELRRRNIRNPLGCQECGFFSGT